MKNVIFAKLDNFNNIDTLDDSEFGISMEMLRRVMTDGKVMNISTPTVDMCNWVNDHSLYMYAKTHDDVIYMMSKMTDENYEQYSRELFMYKLIK